MSDHGPRVAPDLVDLASERRARDALPARVVRGSAAALLELQRRGGNQAARDLLDSGSPAPAPPVNRRTAVIQRYVDPATVAGLNAGNPAKPAFIAAWTTHLKAEYDRVLARAEGPDRDALTDAHRDFLASLTTADGTDATPLQNVALARTGLTNLVAALNTACRAVEKASPAHRGGVKFGTEFTFTHTNLQTLRLGENSDAMRIAEKLIKDWKTKGKDAKPHNKPKAPFARKFVYPTDSIGRSWWWVLDVDEGCIETQTDPTSSDDLKDGSIQQIIENDIFKQASNLGLTPHAEIGGGHLSFDRATMFGDDAQTFRNFLVLYANQKDQWAKMDTDFLNAPFIQELPKAQRQAFIDVITAFDVAYNGPLHQSWSIDRLVQEISNRVYTFVRTTEQTGSAAHYQAVNLEHMADDDSEKRRIEMRRFRSQTGFKDLVYNHLDALLNMLDEARDPNLVPLDPIDMKAINADEIAAKGVVDTAKIRELEKTLAALGKNKKPNTRDVKQLETLSARTPLIKSP